MSDDLNACGYFPPKRTYSLVVEFDSGDLDNRQIERIVARMCKPMEDSGAIKITHLEASDGTLKEAFGVGL